MNSLFLFTDIVLGITTVPIYSNCERKDLKNVTPSPPLFVPINASFPLKPSLQLSVDNDIHVIAFVNIGGEPPLYSGAQKINALAFSNSLLYSFAILLSEFKSGIYKGRS